MSSSPDKPGAAVEIKLPLRDSIDELAARVLGHALQEAGIVEAIRVATETHLAHSGLLTKEQAAKWLRIEESALQIWIRPVGDRGGRGVPHLKIGETVRFRLASLEAWAAQFEVNKILPAAA